MQTVELNEQIEKAAHSVAFDWPGVIEADDIQQEIWIRVLESDKAYNSIRDADPALRMDFLKHMGVQIASRYANDYELFSGNTYYGTDHVRKLLEGGLLTVARSDLGEMGETLTHFLDLHDAFDALKESSEEYAQVVWDAYVAGTYDRTHPTARKKISRAVHTLTDRMNQAHRRRHAEYEEGPGTREVISNAKAQVLVTTEWQGDYNDGRR